MTENKTGFLLYMKIQCYVNRLENSYKNVAKISIFLRFIKFGYLNLAIFDFICQVNSFKRIAVRQESFQSNESEKRRFEPYCRQITDYLSVTPDYTPPEQTYPANKQNG